MTRRHLVLFARLPALGTGKRRLARDIGDVAAARFERQMLLVMMRRLGRDRRWHARLALTPDRRHHRLRDRPRRLVVTGQGAGDLGTRMRHALLACPPGPAVLVGSDIPALAADHIAAAFRLLGRHHLVLGPAEDGGFWLIGARRSPGPLPPFGRVRWSGTHALADLLANLPRRLSVGFATGLDDVDDGPAFRRLAPRRGF